MTPEAALSKQIERYRQMTGEERLAIALVYSSTGAKPRRRQFSVITRGTRKFCKYSTPPALVPPPLILNPPNGWRPTIAPVMPRLMYKLPQTNSALVRSMLTGLRE